MNRKQFFDSHAEKWDTYIKKETIKKIETHIIPKLSLSKSKKILDVGCGTGVLLPILKKFASRKAKITALDYSPKMLQKAKQKNGTDFQYICANVENIPAKSNYFDTVLCFSVFPHFTRKLKALKEINRVLRKNGKLIIAHANSRKTINAHHKKIGFPVSKDLIPTKKQLTKLLEMANFHNISIKDNKTYIVQATK